MFLELFFIDDLVDVFLLLPGGDQSDAFIPDVLVLFVLDVDVVAALTEDLEG
jgi:hypothetical protein